MDPAGGALPAVAEAVLGMAGDLSVDAVLERLVAAARDLAGARYAALGVPDEDQGFAKFITAGMAAEEVEAMGPLPRTHGLLGAMLVDPAPFRTSDITTDPRFRGWWPATHPRMRSFLGVPIVFRGDVIGAFYLTDKVSGQAFTEADEAAVGVLAAHAAVLMEHARLYEESRELSVVEERNRLARELHDAMTQTLFSLRLTLEAAASRLATDPAGAGAELATARGLLDDVFAELRVLIFELRPPALAEDGLVATLTKHLDVVGRAHGLAVSLHTEGDGAARLDPDRERELLRIVQEAVTNAVRHAAATSLEVVLTFGDGVASATVRDDGRGFDPDARAVRSRRLGLTSMRERAQALGGHAVVESAPGHGTTVRVEVPAAGR
jgi:signal transduction histidine kinase